MRTPVLAALLALVALGGTFGSTRWMAPASTAPTLIAHARVRNACGGHFNRKTGECHCHQRRGRGCAYQPAGGMPTLQRLPSVVFAKSMAASVWLSDGTTQTRSLDTTMYPA